MPKKRRGDCCCHSRARHIDFKHSSVAVCRKCTRKEEEKMSKKKAVRPSMSVYHDRRFLHFAFLFVCVLAISQFRKKKADDEIHRIWLSKDRDRVRLFVYLSSFLLSNQCLRLLCIFYFFSNKSPCTMKLH